MATTTTAAVATTHEQLVELRHRHEKEATKAARAHVARDFEDFRGQREVDLAVVKDFLLMNMKKYAPSTMWTRRSHLLTYILDHYEKDYFDSISDIDNALRALDRNYTPRQAKAFTYEEVRKYLELPHTGETLRNQIQVLIGVFGLARSADMVYLTVADVRTCDDGWSVELHRAKQVSADSMQHIIVPRIANVDIDELLSAYLHAIGPGTNERFWRRWRSSKFTREPLGINTIKKVPKDVATTLGLDASLYSGHSFRCTGATLLADAGGTIEDIKRSGFWKSDTVARRYIRVTTQQQRRTAQLLVSELYGRSISFFQEPDEKKPKVASQEAPQEYIAPKIAAAASAITFNNCTFTGCTFSKM